MRRELVFRNVKLGDDTYQIRVSARSRDEWALMARWHPLDVPGSQRHLVLRAAELGRANNRPFFAILPPGPIRVTPGESTYVLFKDEIKPSDDYYLWRHYHLNIRLLSNEAAKTSGNAVSADATIGAEASFHAQQRGRCS